MLISVFAIWDTDNDDCSLGLLQLLGAVGDVYPQQGSMDKR